MQNYKPVPKVLAQTIAGVVAALVVAALAGYGVADEDGAITGAVTTLVLALLPVIAGFVAGWLKTDTERAELLAMLAEALSQQGNPDGDA
jgi:hypothetical protein